MLRGLEERQSIAVMGQGNTWSGADSGTVVTGWERREVGWKVGDVGRWGKIKYKK